MERSASPALTLRLYKGQMLTKEMLRGRGYCQIEDGKVVDDNFPYVDELCWDDDDVEQGDINNITCKKVKEYIASQIGELLGDGGQYWIKGLPACPEDVDNREAYMVLCVGTKSEGDKLRITKIVPLARMVQEIGSGWFSVPGLATMDSHFFEMEFVPPELKREVHALVLGRYIPSSFTLVGKPMPSNTCVFHGNSPYSLANNSGWRNTYLHLLIMVDDNDIIKDFDMSVYERETSMFQRPHSMNYDPADAFDAALMIVDQYSDEEWKDIVG